MKANFAKRGGFLSLVCAAAVMTASAASAQEASIKPTLGTLGFGLEGGYKFNESFGVTGSINGFGFHPSGTYQGTTYDGNAKLFGLGATFDYYVNGSNFRLSAGARWADPSADVTFTKYDPSLGTNRSVLVKLSPEYEFQPYLGVGYGAKVNEKVSIDFALGAYYMGTPQLDEYWDGPVYQSLQNNIDNFRDKISDYKFYPVAQIGVSYRF